MSTFNLGPQDQLYYEHFEPKDPKGYTCVFFNALTGDTTSWEAVIGPMLREKGNGTLAFNFRGQTDSPFSPDLELNANMIIKDAIGLLAEVKPVRPIFVGLSIGGLFAARAWLEGARAVGLVLINTLRQDGPRLKWLGDALVRAVEVGGLDLFKDLFMPLLASEEWQSANRINFLKSGGYTPLDPMSGSYKLLAEAGRTADWNLPYERLDLPALVITGLQDHIFFDRDVVENLFSQLPQGKRLDLKDAGHLITAEKPEELGKAILDFVAGL